jgi:hypothetical protein
LNFSERERVIYELMTESLEKPKDTIVAQALRGDITYSRWSNGRVTGTKFIRSESGEVDEKGLGQVESDDLPGGLNWVDTTKPKER